MESRREEQLARVVYAVSLLKPSLKITNLHTGKGKLLVVTEFRNLLGQEFFYFVALVERGLLSHLSSHWTGIMGIFSVGILLLMVFSFE